MAYYGPDGVHSTSDYKGVTGTSPSKNTSNTNNNTSNNAQTSTPTSTPNAMSGDKRYEVTNGDQAKINKKAAVYSTQLADGSMSESVAKANMERLEKTMYDNNGRLTTDGLEYLALQQALQNKNATTADGNPTPSNNSSSSSSSTSPTGGSGQSGNPNGYAETVGASGGSTGTSKTKNEYVPTQSDVNDFQRSIDEDNLRNAWKQQQDWAKKNGKSAGEPPEFQFSDGSWWTIDPNTGDIIPVKDDDTDDNNNQKSSEPFDWDAYYEKLQKSYDEKRAQQQAEQEAKAKEYFAKVEKERAEQEAANNATTNTQAPLPGINEPVVEDVPVEDEVNTRDPLPAINEPIVYDDPLPEDKVEDDTPKPNPDDYKYVAGDTNRWDEKPVKDTSAGNTDNMYMIGSGNYYNKNNNGTIGDVNKSNRYGVDYSKTSGIMNNFWNYMKGQQGA